MRFVIQRVTNADVKVDGQTLGEIGKGFMVLIGVSDTDTKEIADKMIKKMIGLRIFEDENGKTNLSLETVGGSLLLISQFTLYAKLVKKETVQALLRQESRRWQKKCTNILSKNAGKVFR